MVYNEHYIEQNHKEMSRVKQHNLSKVLGVPKCGVSLHRGFASEMESYFLYCLKFKLFDAYR